MFRPAPLEEGESGTRARLRRLEDDFEQRDFHGDLRSVEIETELTKLELFLRKPTTAIALLESVFTLLQEAIERAHRYPDDRGDRASVSPGTCDLENLHAHARSARART